MILSNHKSKLAIQYNYTGIFCKLYNCTSEFNNYSYCIKWMAIGVEY